MKEGVEGVVVTLNHVTGQLPVVMKVVNPTLPLAQYHTLPYPQTKELKRNLNQELKFNHNTHHN